MVAATGAFSRSYLYCARGNVKIDVYAKKILIFSWRESGFFHIFATANQKNA